MRIKISKYQAVVSLTPYCFPLRNPFLDVIGAMKDFSQALTAHEVDEWGGRREEDYQYMMSYSPLQNIGVSIESHENMKKKHFPAVYISIGMQDFNVSPIETLNWVHKLRNYRRDSNTDDGFQRDVEGRTNTFFRISPEASHSGPRCLETLYEERALEIAFLEHVTAAWHKNHGS